MKRLPVDTMNRHMVVAHKGRVHILVPRDLTPVQACELAAWLVVGAEMATHQRPDEAIGVFDPDEHFAAALAAVRKT